MSADFRSRNFCLLLYPEWDNFLDIIHKCAEIGDFCRIDHYPENEDKKMHVHLLLIFKNARKCSSLVNKLGIEDRFIQKCKDREEFIKYMIHYGYKDKIQYSVDDIVCSSDFIQDIVNRALNPNVIKVTKGAKFVDICNYILKSKCVVNILDIYWYCVEKDCIGIYKAYYTQIKDIIWEHNKIINLTNPFEKVGD